MSFFTKIGRARREPVSMAWLQRMQQQAQGRALMATDRLGPTAQRARMMAGDRVMGARRWSAPQLRRAAGVMENQISPRVCAALMATARRMEPPRRSHRVRNTFLVLLGTIGAVGVAGALYSRFRMNDAEYEEFTEQIESSADSMPGRPSYTGSGQFAATGLHDASHRPESRPGSSDEMRGAGQH